MEGKVEDEQWHREHDNNVRPDPQDRSEFWAVQRQVMKEQDIGQDADNYKTEALLRDVTTNKDGGVFEDIAEVSIDKELDG